MAAKAESDLVDDGFETHFGKIYAVFIDSYGSAKTPAEQKAAIATFQTRVKTARDVRDTARKNLP